MADDEHDFLNTPGHWDFFLSHTQRNPDAKLLASEMYYALTDLAKTSWLDVKMEECDADAMEEGVRNSMCFVAIVTDSYFSRAFCCLDPRMTVLRNLTQVHR